MTKTELAVKAAIEAALAPHIAVITELQQELHNLRTTTKSAFVKTQALLGAHKDEIKYLRAQVEALTPAVTTPVATRVSKSDWDWAKKLLEDRTPGQKYFPVDLIRATAAERNVAAVAQTEPEEEEAVF